MTGKVVSSTSSKVSLSKLGHIKTHITQLMLFGRRALSIVCISHRANNTFYIGYDMKFRSLVVKSTQIGCMNQRVMI